MLVANIVTNRSTMGDTRTFEDFSKFLGERPHRLGVVSRLYPQLTATFLTEALRNIYYADSKPNKFQNTDSTYFELTEQLTNILMLELNPHNCQKIKLIIGSII